MLFDILMALWNVSIKSRETKLLVRFFLLYLGISCLPALMSLAAFSQSVAISHVAITDEEKYPLRVIPSPVAHNNILMPAHPVATPTITIILATPTLSVSIGVGTKSQEPAGGQANIIETGALFHQSIPPARPPDLPTDTHIVVVTPTRLPAVPTPIGKAVPTLTPEPRVTTIMTTPTPLPLPTSVIPIPITPIVPLTPVSGQNIASGGHS